jgi:hypothetical protein
VRKLFAPVAALALVLMTAGIVLAWVQPTLTAECAPDANNYAWKINLHTEDNYKIDWSFDSTFGTFTTVDFLTAGDHSFTTVRGGTTLYVRWFSDHSSKASAAANAELCTQVEQSIPASVAQSIPASVEQSVAASVAQSVAASVAQSVAASVPASAEQSVKAGTGTPAASTPNTSTFGGGSGPLPTVIFSMVLLASLGTLAYTNVKVARVPRRNR